jgi:hypothetical protein
MSLEVLLQGGLGNQLFQGLAALRLAQLTKQDLIINCNWFDRQLASRQEVDGIRMYELARHPLFEDCKLSFKPRSGVRSAYNYSPLSFQKKLGLVSDVTYGDSIYPNTRPRFMSGFFQTKNILQCFNLSEILTLSEHSNDYTKFLKEIRETKSTGIHIRLGDYLSDSKFAVVSRDYIQASISHVLKDLSDDNHFYIFSDSPELIYEFYPETKHLSHTLVLSKTFSGMETILLMAHCEKLILSHSTFSWWAGALASEKGGKVYAPVKKGELTLSGHFESKMLLNSWHGIGDG